jgi:hypothetical protein
MTFLCWNREHGDPPKGGIHGWECLLEDMPEQLLHFYSIGYYFRGVP